MKPEQDQMAVLGHPGGRFEGDLSVCFAAESRHAPRSGPIFWGRTRLRALSDMMVS